MSPLILVLILAANVFSNTAQAGDIAALSVVKPVVSCATLIKVDLQDIGGKGSRVTSASETTNNGIAACEVQGKLAPSIVFKVLLPTQTWTQRYLQVGCGGLCGRLSLQVGAADGCTPLNNGGFVLASTDMGHLFTDHHFGDDPQKRADFAYRGVHLTAVAAKKLTAVFYGQQPVYAYFSGCSDGGREALMEAQRYPDDFNGIVAGAPASNFQVQKLIFHAWQTRSNQDEQGKPILIASRLPILHKAVLEQCDGLDGQVDGLISDPRACHFDPATVQCEASATGTENCLTEQEVTAARRLYDGPHDPITGERMTIGGPLPGSELAWAGVFVPFSADQQTYSEATALDVLRNLSFEHNPGPDTKLADLPLDRSTFDQLRALHPLYDATNPDLSAFAGQGAKLILWHGWADPYVSPLNSIAYQQAMEAQMGASKVQSFERFYLLPGVYHCAGGEGPSRIDLLTPMMSWVEKDQAPDAVLAMPASSEGHARPVFPYPDVAVYDPRGDMNSPASYVRGEAWLDEKTPDWMGSDFFQPYEPLEQ